MSTKSYSISPALSKSLSLMGSDAANIITAELGASSVTTAKIADGSVTTAKVADNAITNLKLANDAVNTDQLVNIAVTSAKIANGAVNADQIADGAVNADKIDIGAVGTDQIADDAVTNSKIADNAVTTAKIADDAVTNAKLANDVVDTAQLVDNAVTTAKITDANITTAKVADLAITDAKINGMVANKLAQGTANVDLDAGANDTIAISSTSTTLNIGNTGATTSITYEQLILNQGVNGILRRYDNAVSVNYATVPTNEDYVAGLIIRTASAGPVVWTLPSGPTMFNAVGSNATLGTNFECLIVNTSGQTITLAPNGGGNDPITNTSANLSIANNQTARITFVFHDVTGGAEHYIALVTKSN